jgi:hypothetical protein
MRGAALVSSKEKKTSSKARLAVFTPFVLGEVLVVVSLFAAAGRVRVAWFVRLRSCKDQAVQRI